jgi:hypothetical protein
MERFEGQFINCRAKAIRYSSSIVWVEKRPCYKPTLLLKEVTHLDSLIADHVWIMVRCEREFLKVLPGDPVEFSGQVYRYSRKNGTAGWSFQDCKDVVPLVEPEEFLTNPRRYLVSEDVENYLHHAAGAMEMYHGGENPQAVGNIEINDIVPFPHPITEVMRDISRHLLDFGDLRPYESVGGYEEMSRQFRRFLARPRVSAIFAERIGQIIDATCVDLPLNGTPSKIWALKLVQTAMAMSWDSMK